MSSVSSNAQDVDIDVKTLLANVWSRRFLVLTMAIIFTIIAFVITLFITPKYDAETSVLIETTESVYSQPTAVANQGATPPMDPAQVASQINIIGSTDLLQKVAKELNLDMIAEFSEESVFSFLGFGAETGQTLDSIVLKNMRERLTITRSQGSHVIVIRFVSKDPELASTISNTIAKTYISTLREAKQESDGNAAKWLEPEIEKLRAQLLQTETQIASFRTNNDLTLGANNSALATQQLSELSSELTRVRSARAGAQARAQAIESALKNGGSIEAVPNVQSSSVVQRLIERQVALRGEIADRTTVLLDSHPRIKALRSQLRQIDDQIRSEAKKVLIGLKTEAKAAKIRETELIADVNKLKVEAGRVGEFEVNLRAMDREANAQRTLLESYETRLREAQSRQREEYTPVDARIISPAVMASQPYFPKIIPILAATFVGTILMMCVWFLIGELFSGRAMQVVEHHGVRRHDEDIPNHYEEHERHEVSSAITPEQIRKMTSRPQRVSQPVAPAQMAASMSVPAQPIAQKHPAPAPAPAPVVTQKVNQSMNEAEYTHPGISISQGVSYLVERGAVRAIFISPEGDEGSVGAIQTARQLADGGLRTALVDLTSRGTPSQIMLEGTHQLGISNLLAGDAPLEKIIYGDNFSMCDILPKGTGSLARAINGVEQLPILLDTLANVYDIVIVECGPTSANGISQLVDDNSEVLVCAINPIREDVVAIIEDLMASGFNNLKLINPGVASNDGNEKQKSRVA